MKKTLIFGLTSLLLLTGGCGKTENETINNENIKYTNKYECSRVEKYTVMQMKMKTGYFPNDENISNSENSVETNISHIYDFSSDGKKLLSYYDEVTYKYLTSYDMDKQKEYFEQECENIDKKTYKKCTVSVSNDSIKVTSEVNLDSEESKSYLTNVTLDEVKENYAESTYTCK